MISLLFDIDHSDIKTNKFLEHMQLSKKILYDESLSEVVYDVDSLNLKDVTIVI